MVSPTLTEFLELDAPWDIKTKNFLRRLIENTADPAIRCAYEKPPPLGIINILNADCIFIESGKEDLRYAPGLFSVLDTLEDDRKRDGAYRALFLLLQGVFYIAAHAVTPIDSMKQSDVPASQAALARRQKARKMQPKMQARIEIVRAVIAEKTKDGRKRPSVSKLLKPVNDRLSAAGRDELTERQLRSDLGKI